MASNPKEATEANNSAAPQKSGTHVNNIDREAPAGSENSLGAESVRDGRPSTDDSVIEAMDEEGPDVSIPGAKDEGSKSR